MFEAARRHMRSVAMIGVASALTVGGVAVAQGGSGGADVQPAKRPMPILGNEMSSLAYAELHFRDADGRTETIRIEPAPVSKRDTQAARKGDVVRALHGSPLPPLPGGGMQFEVVQAPSAR